LNRRELWKPRSDAMGKVARELERLKGLRRRPLAGPGAAMSHPAARVSKALKGSLTFAAARRQTAREVLEGLGRVGREIMELVAELRPEAENARWKDRQRRSRARRPAFVKSLRIENFKAIRRLDLAFDTGAGDEDGSSKASWNVFLGENGVG